jgi:hypothetical protein
MVALGPAVAAHAARLGPCFFSSAALTVATTAVSTIVLLDGKGHHELDNGVPQYLQLHHNFVGLLLSAIANVGGNFFFFSSMLTAAVAMSVMYIQSSLPLLALMA